MASGLFSSLRSLLGKLQDAIGGSEEDPKQTKSIEDDLNWLGRMLRRIEAALQDAEEREIREHSVELWLRELRGVAHEAEDLLDEYHYELLKSMVAHGNDAIEIIDIGSKRKIKDISSLASSSSAAQITTPKGMADNIKRIRERFEEISKAREDLHLMQHDGEQQISSLPRRAPTSSHIDEKDFYGRENEKEEIIRLLNLEDGSQFVAVPIVGKGGLGKTALAQLVYNDPKVSQFFTKRAWISVSEGFDLVRLTKATIESINKEPCSFLELSNLQDILKENLDGDRLFLVLDDVWNEERDLWERFRIVFNAAKIVRVLITTRNFSVANIMQTMSPFTLGHLPFEASWMLFNSCAFYNKDINVHSNLLDIGCQIVKKCEGLPLAVKVLGSLLRYETDEEKWRDVLESDTWLIDEKNEIMPILMLSYSHMPLHLRPCFLYLSVLPKNTELDKEHVIRLWMAQGYINSKTHKTLENVGGEYFEELQCRSLIDSLQSDNYILHDLIHDLARSITERMYPTLDRSEQWDSSFSVYHLYLNAKKLVSTMPSYITSNNHRSIRTLFGYKLCYFQIDCPIILTMVCLRVLELCGDIVYIMPDVIGNFKHLRYLKIRGFYLQRFPESLCALYNLQTLDLLKCYSLQELPRDIGNLINLRCFLLGSNIIEQLPDSICCLSNLQILKLSNCSKLKELPSETKKLTSLRVLELPYLDFGVEMPLGFEKLTNLKTLRGTLNVSQNALTEGLGELKNLVNLGRSMYIGGIGNITNVEYTKKTNIKSKSNLEFLELDFHTSCYYILGNEEFRLRINDLSSLECLATFKVIEESVLESLEPHCNIKELVILDYGGTKFPSWIGDPTILPNLTRLDLLHCCHEKCTFLPSLGQLPSLKILLINGPNVQKIGNEFGRDGFSNVAFPALEKLVLSDMPKWEEWIGLFDGDFPCLKELSIADCPNLRKFPTVPNNVEQLRIIKCGINEIQFALPSKIQSVNIYTCIELTSVIWVLDNDLSCFKDLSISSCPNLRKLPTIPSNLEQLQITECGINEIQLALHSNIQSVSICHCTDLTSIIGLNGHNSLRELVLEYCPLLELSMADFLELFYSYPRVKITTLRNVYFCKRDDTLTEFSGLDNYEGIFPECFEVVCTGEESGGQLLIKPKFQQFMLLNLPMLEDLVINNCEMERRNRFENLKRVCIFGFPKLRQWTDCWGVLVFLEYLEVSCCEDLIAIPPLGKMTALLEINIWNCPKLNVIVGLHCLTSLRTLFLKGCQNLRAYPNENLEFSIAAIEICDCPNMREWCQLNNFVYSESEVYGTQIILSAINPRDLITQPDDPNAGVPRVADGEASNNMIE